MLQYEWGNPSTMMLSGDEASHQEPDHHRQIYDHYSTAAPQPFNDNLNLLPHPNSTAAAAAAALFHHQTPTHHHPTHNPFYDPRSYAASSPYAATPHPSLLSLDPTPSPAAAGAGGGSAHSYFLVPKTEDVSRASDFTARIGLNLGGRTYFSSADDDFVNRLYRRSRPFDAGTTNAPRCQAEGCNADLTHAKHYHRRHKVCEFHSKASTVIAAGLTQRFCQQCSR